jgi:hypothetical protein
VSPVQVLSLVPRPIYPFHSGGEIRIGALMRGLAPRYEFTVLTFFTPGAELEQAAEALELERRHGIRSIFCRRTPGLATDPGKPSIAADFWDPAMVRTLRAAIEERGIDLVQIEFTQMAQYAGHAADLAPVVLTEHDSSILTPGDSYFRTGDDGVEHSSLVRSHLASCFSRCRRIVTVSAADAARLEPLAGPGKMRVVPTGAETGGSRSNLSGREEASALFVGHYRTFPTRRRRVPVPQVLPQLRRRVPARAVLVVRAHSRRGPWPTSRGVVGTVADVAPISGARGVPRRCGSATASRARSWRRSARAAVVATPGLRGHAGVRTGGSCCRRARAAAPPA